MCRYYDCSQDLVFFIMEIIYYDLFTRELVIIQTNYAYNKTMTYRINDMYVSVDSQSTNEENMRFFC